VSRAFLAIERAAAFASFRDNGKFQLARLAAHGSHGLVVALSKRFAQIVAA
jgi:hypothetical protein